ncbi:acyl-CoA thioesterase [Jatrophihabitans sp. DSM 45814]
MYELAEFRWHTDVLPAEDDYDLQGHLNHVSTFRIMTTLKTGYLREVLDGAWHRQVAERTHVWVVGEVHVRYASEGMPGERFVGHTRVPYRSGRAVVIESLLTVAGTERLIAHAWTVQLVSRSGRAESWPPEFLDAIQTFEGRPIANFAGKPRAAFGALSPYNPT